MTSKGLGQTGLSQSSETTYVKLGGKSIWHSVRPPLAHYTECSGECHLVCHLSGAEWWSISDKSYMVALHCVQLSLEPCNPCPSLIFPHTKILLCGIKRVHSLNNPKATTRLPNYSIKQAIKGFLSQQSHDYDNNLGCMLCRILWSSLLRRISHTWWCRLHPQHTSVIGQCGTYQPRG